jgi:hypothetical protein
LERSGKPLGELPIMSIENPTLVHFRHFSSLLTNEYRVSRYESFMQNKPNFRNVQMAVTLVKTMTNNNKPRTMNNERLCKTNPIKANFKSSVILNHNWYQRSVIGTPYGEER